jgi:hypothetical protein
MKLRSTGKKDGSVGLATQAMKQESMHEVDSAFQNRKAMFGPFKPGICGAVMADFMHQWLEGMAKHVIDWITLLVEATGTGTLADFDARFANIEVRHSDTTTPTKPFANGVCPRSNHCPAKRWCLCSCSCREGPFDTWRRFSPSATGPGSNEARPEAGAIMRIEVPHYSL